MKLYLKGHTERYPVEQLQLQLFPQEASEFVEVPFSDENGTISALFSGDRWVTAAATVYYNGEKAYAQKRIAKQSADVRHVRRILQQSYYLAAAKLLPKLPPWGALSGVRPSKLSTKCMQSGGTRRDADRILRDVYFVSPERRRLCLDASEHTLEAAGLLEKNDLSVYIGIPFCPTRCAYCSFVSQSIERFGDYLPPYLQALHREIEYTGKLLKSSGCRIRSLYMGGGTPTTLDAQQMQSLLSRIRDSFELSGCLEFTVEGGRPDTLDEEKLRVLKDGGCTRISINPQTMSDGVLAAIGRRHSCRQTLEAYEAAKRVGFDDINMDLIAGLPGDDAKGFSSSVAQLIALQPSNITVHTLALKKGAELFHNRIPMPSADEVGRMLTDAMHQLRSADFEPYYLYRQKYMSGSFENVGWCRPGYTGYYNIYMMEELHTVLSLGGGGMNKINLPAGALERWHNPKYPQDYIDRIETILQQKDEIFALLSQLDGMRRKKE